MRIVCYRLLAVLLPLGLLEILCRSHIIPPLTLPPPSQIVMGLWEILAHGSFNAAIVKTLRWLVLPFVILFAIMLGFAIPHANLHVVKTSGDWQGFTEALAFTIAKFCAAQSSATDSDVLAGMQSLAETYKTLRSGIYYEKPPVAQLPRELYAALTAFIAEVKQQQAEHSNGSAVKDSDIFSLLVFLYRMGLLRTNGRPRSRRFIEFLRSQFPEASELKREESRIIVP